MEAQTNFTSPVVNTVVPCLRSGNIGVFMRFYVSIRTKISLGQTELTMTFNWSDQAITWSIIQ